MKSKSQLIREALKGIASRVIKLQSLGNQWIAETANELITGICDGDNVKIEGRIAK